MKVGDIIGEGPKAMEVIDLISGSTARVKFVKTGYVTEAKNGNILKGLVKDKLLPVVYNIGYIGEGPYGTSSKFYQKWNSMLYRCYASGNTSPRAEVVPEWLNFQTFAEWCTITYKEGYELDKDLLGSTTYGPEHCVWLPKNLNNALNTSRVKASGLPPGVTEKSQRYDVRCMDSSNTRRCLGSFGTAEEAFTVYKAFKEKVLRELADSYYAKGLISLKIRDLFYNYKVKNNACLLP